MNLAHIGISVADLDITVKWYGEVLGFKELKRFEKKELEIKGALLSNGEILLEALMPFNIVKKQAPPPSLIQTIRLQGLNHIAINVADVKAFYRKLQTQQVSLLTDLVEDRFFFCHDPDGVVLEIKQKQ